MRLPNEVAYAAAGMASYFIGAIPFGFVAARVFKGVDLRKVGSGNIGATNAARALGTAWFVPIFVLDFLKGFAPVFWLAPWLARQLPCAHCIDLGAMLAGWCGICAMAGHLFPIYLGFKGGKGVATGGGIVLAINWIAGLLGLGIFAVVFLATRYVSVGSLVAAISLPFAHWVTAERAGWVGPSRVVLTVVVAMFAAAVVFRHRGNLRRLKDGTEPKVRFSSR